VLLYLVHHADAVAPDLDARRPLSEKGRAEVERVATKAAANGAKPSVIWHSGKLRAKQTAEAFWKICNPLAELSATRGLQPDDPPQWIRDRLRSEPRDILIAGHFPYLPRLLALLVTGGEAGVVFPEHGVVALITDDEGETWREVWRVEN
jgi:phosphohistidine phosphatase